MEELICLGVEGTAHTFGVGIVREDGKILADERSTYKPPLGKGIIPSGAARHHKQHSKKVLRDALIKANLKINDINILSYSAGPGIPPPLVFTANFAIGLSEKHKKIIVPVNHCVAHIEIGKLMTNVKDPVCLYVSGGNTQILAFAEGRYRIFGETQDIPIGNARDTLARELGFEMPGGPIIDELAKSGEWIKLPYVIKGVDSSFSGIVTGAIKKFKSGYKIEDVCYSFQEVTFAMLTEVVERALAHTGKREVLLIGGVAASPRLQEMIKIMCKERGATSHVVPQEYSSDNGVNIAWAGILSYKYNKYKVKERIMPNWRTDEVDWFED